MNPIRLACAFAISLCGPASFSFAAEGKIDVSAIINKAEAESIMGEPVKTPRPRSMEGTDGYYSKCTYYSATSRKSLVLRVHQPNSESVDANSQFQNVIADVEVQTLSDLGDSAAVLKGGLENGMPDTVVMLYVVKGNALVTIGLGGITNESLALEKVKFVARKLLAHL